MKYYIKLVGLFAIFFAGTTLAQITAIPDPAFEKALVDLNIDSDGIVNGQVLTADIENIVELDFSTLYDNEASYDEGIIEDFTGIEGFNSLEVLNISNLWIELPDDQANVFNFNYNLKTFIADQSSVDSSPFLCIPKVDFSNLANLESISFYNNCNLSLIDLKNPSVTRENLSIDLSHEYWDPPFTSTVCIKVNDSQAATSNAFPYNTWDVVVQLPDENGYAYVDYTFSSTCTLSISEFDFMNSLIIYPNPVKDKLWIENPNQINVDRVEIYTVSGKIVGSFSMVSNFIDVQHLKAGMYFVKFYSEHSSITLKFLKNRGY